MKAHTKERKSRIILILSIALLIVSIYPYQIFFINFIENNECTDIAWYEFFGLSLLYFCVFFVLIGRVNGCVRSIKWNKKFINVIWNILLFFLVTFSATLMEEVLWNDNMLLLKHFSLDYMIFTAIAFAVVLWIPKMWIAYSVILVGDFIYGLVNHFVYEFKGCPPMFNDILATKTATTVMGSYSYIVDLRILYGGSILFLIFILMMIIPPSNIKMPEKASEFRVTAWAIRIALPFIAIFGMKKIDLAERFQIEIYAWEPIVSFYDNGAPATMLLSYQYAKPEKPDGYSISEANRILSEYKLEDSCIGDALQKKPIIIAIMNESFSDIQVLGDFETDPYLSYWYSDDTYIRRGYVFSSVYGGGTCNAEYEFLTGNTMANAKVGTYPYLSYNLVNTENIVGYLRDMEGYNTVAFHPYIAENWNRPFVYEQFGFNRFMSWLDMADSKYLSWTISDYSNYEKIENILDEYQNHEEPLFIFNVTMQNHGGYFLDVVEQNTQPIWVADEYKQYADVVAYLTLIRESDYEFAQFIENLRQRSEPIVVCMFGDHQPDLDSDFLDTIFVTEGENDIENRQKLQMTPYVIWANYNTGMEQMEENMSINYLGANLMNVAGYHTSYVDYLLDLQKDIPVIDVCGYQTSDGQWHSLEEENERLNEYKIVQYYETFEVKE